MRLTIRVFGRPAPQGSKELGGAGQLRESSRYLAAWRRQVVIGAYRAYAAVGVAPTALPIFPAGAPVHLLLCTFIVTEQQCRADDTDDPVGKPDVDKLLRSTLDALGGRTDPRNTARLFADDSQVTRVRELGKVRATAEQPAGAIIIASDGRV